MCGVGWGHGRGSVAPFRISVLMLSAVENSLVDRILDLSLEEDTQTALSFVFLAAPGKEGLFSSDRITRTLTDFIGTPPRLNKQHLPLIWNILHRPSHGWFDVVQKVVQALIVVAIRKRENSSVKCLVKTSVSLNFLAPQGLSPLMLAAKSNDTALLEILLEGDLLISFRNTKGMDAYQIAKAYRRAEALEILERAIESEAVRFRRVG